LNNAVRGETHNGPKSHSFFLFCGSGVKMNSIQMFGENRQMLHFIFLFAVAAATSFAKFDLRFVSFS
jgi:hypothetical protein